MMMKNTKGVEEKILAKYEKNMRENEDALLTIHKRKMDLEQQEDNFYAVRIQLTRYCEEQRQKYAGTDEMIRYNRMENDVHELTGISRDLLDKEYEKLKREEKQLYQQQDKYYEEYLSEVRYLHSKEGN
jgi:hypothetical protein